MQANEFFKHPFTLHFGQIVSLVSIDILVLL